MLIYMIVALALLLSLFVYLFIKKQKEAKQYFLQTQEKEELLKKYSSIISIEDEIQKLEKDKSDEIFKIDTLRNDYKNKLEIFNQLTKALQGVEEEYELTTYGFYKPTYIFETSEEYKRKLEEVQKKQKNMLLQKDAVICNEKWTIQGSVSEGTKFTNKAIKLTLRAFNGECDSTITKVKWNNYNTMKERIIKSYDLINKLNESSKIIIENEYLDLKLEELKLTYECQEKIYQEKEEQRAIREQMREEEKAQKEIEKVQQDAEKEEAMYQKALKKVREQLLSAKAEEMGELKLKIETLEKSLNEAISKKERALSMAQQTRSGHVYVISNIGSFGDDIYKIGMTRRLEPMDRVRELGDASVPFLFDVHAMIYSKDAPSLEKELHREFNYSRVNMVTGRKEFFNISMREIEDKIKTLGETIEFTKIAEAKEFRESIALKNANMPPNTVDTLDEKRFPDEL